MTITPLSGDIMPNEGIQSSRLVHLDGLRTIAFLSVFLHHSLSMPLLWAGVDLFFVLSGFLITGILFKMRESSSYFKTFYYRRFLRIFPPYYLILFLVFLFLDAKWEQHWLWYVLYLSNFQDAFVGNGFHMLDPMWSLAIEEQFYIIWPLLVYYLGQKGVWRLSAFLVVVTPLARGILTIYWHDFKPVYHLLFTRADLLAAGALLAILWQRSPTLFRRFSQWAPIFSLICLMFFAYLAKLFPDFKTSANSLLFNTVGYSLIGGIMVGFVAYCIPFRDNMFFKILSNRVMVYLGTISYMMYLSHQILLDLVRKLGLPSTLNSVVALIAIVAWSALSWHMFEKPLQALKDKLKYAKGTIQPVMVCKERIVE